MASTASTPYPWLTPAFERLAAQAANGALHHALLITGAEGAALNDFATALAEVLVCEAPSSAGGCGTCHACRMAEAGSHPDYLAIEPESDDRPVIKIDQIRELVEALTLASHGRGHRVAVIKAADHLNLNAANSLLKTLEEPPPGVILILIAPAVRRLPATIRSRCRIVTLPLPDEQQARQWLKSQGRDDAIPLLALSGGAPLQALALTNAGTQDHAQQLMADLKAALHRQTSASQLANKWQGYGVDSLITLTQHVIADALRAKAAGSVAVRIPGMEELVRVVASCDWRVLYEYSDDLHDLRRAQEQPLNETLALERVFLGWVRHLGGSSVASQA